jgi:hypothetical protein
MISSWMGAPFSNFLMICLLMRSHRYFYDILQQTPESVEDVMVEADGQWHTVDNKYGSPTWLIAHPPKPDPSTEKNVSQPAKPVAPKVTNGKDKIRPNGAEVFVLDSDDEDEGRVKRELSFSSDQNFPPMTQLSQQSMTQTASQKSTVIDLTLDSDDEESPRPTQKRKAVDTPSPTEQIWKKSRPTNNGVGSSTAEHLCETVYTNGHLSPSMTSRPRNPYNAVRHLYNTYSPASSDYRRPAESRW